MDARLHDLPVRRSLGFTIVEVLMVVSIIILLFSLVMVASGPIRRQMGISRTKTMIVQIRDGLEDYKRLMGSYPPDGYDFEVKNQQGTRIWGIACVYDCLTRELNVEEKVSGQVRRSKHDPITSFTEKDLLREDPAFEGAREIVDGFGLQFHYDNTEDGKFQPEKQGDVAHLETVDDHPVDPRTSDDTAVVPHKGIQRLGAYDLWSHGSAQAHNDPKVPLSDTIGTWNVDVEKKS